jgi:very-short-patch-repair endonuclease
MKEAKMLPYNKSLTQNARELRKNMTPEEKHLWYDFLKKLPFNVHRQHNIENYIVDFYIAEKKIVIEVDGVQHLSNRNQQLDAQRDSNLSNWGIKVLRYPNDRIRDSFTEVAEDILENLGLTFSDLLPVKTK